jgi:formamidopyrimidine-DNA glycosylase
MGVGWTRPAAKAAAAWRKREAAIIRWHTGPTMPERPDLIVYAERLLALAGGSPLRELRIGHPFVLRSVSPPPAAFVGHALRDVRLIGKRVVLQFDAGLAAVIHLMIAGRLHWLPAGKAPPRNALAALRFDAGTIALTEAGTQRRAALHLVEGDAALAAFDAGGLDPLAIDAEAFAARLRCENHTLKRTLTDTALFAGIGNAYSDEILHRARLSPLALTRSLDDGAAQRLWHACRGVLTEWTERLRAEAQAAGGWPKQVTAFRPQMAVHGRFGQPCPDCGAPVQRIVYASNECNYCARCQTGGKLLADRALSRLLRASWPKTIDDV